MMRTLACLLLMLPLSATPQTDLQIRAAEIVGWGVFEAKNSSRNKGFRRNAPPADTVKGVRFLEFTNEIPPQLGTGFGFQYVINSSPRGGRIEVKNVIRFPGEGLKAPGGRVYKESSENRRITIGQRDFYGYAFDEPWEIVPGEWVFEVWHGEARLIRKTFTVLDSAEEES